VGGGTRGRSRWVSVSTWSTTTRNSSPARPWATRFEFGDWFTGLPLLTNIMAMGGFCASSSPRPEQGLGDRAMVGGPVGGLHRLVRSAAGLCSWARRRTPGNPRWRKQGARSASTQRRDLRVCWVLVQAPPEEARTRASWARTRARRLAGSPPRVSSHAAASSASGRASSSAPGTPRSRGACRSRYPRSSRPSSRITLALAHRELRVVGPRGFCHVLVAEVRRLAPHRVDQDHAAAAPAHLLEDRHRVEVGGHRVAATESSTTRLFSMSDGSWPARHPEVERLAGPRGAAAE